MDKNPLPLQRGARPLFRTPRATREQFRVLPVFVRFVHQSKSGAAALFFRHPDAGGTACPQATFVFSVVLFFRHPDEGRTSCRGNLP